MSRLMDITVILVHQTDGAILVAEDEEHEGVWLPKSRVEFVVIRKTKSGHDVAEVTLPEYLAQEKGLI